MKENNNYRLTLLADIRILIFVFMVSLLVSGITALPLKYETDLAKTVVKTFCLENQFGAWIVHVANGVSEMDRKYPFMAYGTDWLAFAHFVIATAFIGPWRDPVRNRWVIDFGLIACAGIFPLAILAAPIRGIPFFWTIIDCSFGLLGGVLLLWCRTKINQLDKVYE